MEEKENICNKCSQPEKFDQLNKNNKKDIKSANKYCKEHLQSYSSHKGCKPEWCEECGLLINYLIQITYET